MLSDASHTTTFSPDEFLAHAAARDRTELVRGLVCTMSPTSVVHGLVSGNVFSLLSAHVRRYRLGVCFADSTGYVLPNLRNTVRAPDASFVRADRLTAERLNSTRFFDIAPDLAVEVLSPGESLASVAEKLADYRVAGVSCVWVVDPADRIVLLRTGNAEPITLGEADTLSGGDIVQGFACSVSRFFEGLTPTR